MWAIAGSTCASVITSRFNEAVNNDKDGVAGAFHENGLCMKE